MAFELPPLPYAKDALAPHMSEQTLNFHHGKHHQTYVNNLNGLVEGTEHEGKSLEEIILGAGPGGLFNNSAQVWNHTFFWNSMKPGGGGEPGGALGDAIKARWGSFDDFKKAFSASAVGNFGSGWTWLVKNPQGGVEIVNTSNADTPLRTANVPVLTVDVWEHAYYVDKRNARPAYVEAWWNVVDWNVAAQRFGA